MMCPSASAPTSTARPRTGWCGSSRNTARHEIADLNVTSQLRGAALTDSYLEGDNSLVVATDTQKNTIYAFAKEHGIPSPGGVPAAAGGSLRAGVRVDRGGLWQAEQYEWERILVDGQPHDHSFVRKGQGTRLATVQVVDAATHVTGGVKDLVVLKTTGSEFAGFPATGTRRWSRPRDR